MKKFYKCLVAIGLIFLSITIIHAAYFEGSGGCAFNGSGNRTCCGAGTSDVSDLLGYMYKGSGKIFIIGSPFGVFYIWRCNYFWKQSAFGNLFVNNLYGYVLEIPKSNYTEHTYYFIQVTSCPTIIVLTPQTKGYIPPTNLSYSTLYTALRHFSIGTPSCPGPCNMIPGSYRFQYPDFFEATLSSHSSNALFLNSLVSLQYGPLEGEDCLNPLKIAKQYGLRVKKGTCPSTYVLEDYPNTVPQACNNPIPSNVPKGARLVEQGFNFNVLNRTGGACALSVALGNLDAAPSSTSFLLLYRKVALLREPYNDIFTLNVLVQSDTGIVPRQPLWELC